MTKEAKVFVRDGIPWINPVCPCCEHSLYEKPKFCPNCGQELSFNNYEKTLDNRKGIKLTDEWTEFIPGVDLEKKAAMSMFSDELDELEQSIARRYPGTTRGDPGSVRAKRQEYIKSVFGE